MMNDFNTRLTNALDLRRHADITPDPEILPKLETELRARHGVTGQLNRNAFAAPPLGSFGAIVVAASILLFALVSPENLSTNSHTATLSLAQADSGVYADSIRILPAAVEDVLTDSLSSTPSDSTSL